MIDKWGGSPLDSTIEFVHVILKRQLNPLTSMIIVHTLLWPLKDDYIQLNRGHMSHRINIKYWVKNISAFSTLFVGLLKNLIWLKECFNISNPFAKNVVFEAFIKFCDWSWA